MITMSPDFFARELLALGADAVHGSRFPAPPYAGVAFDPSGILTPDDKPRLVGDRARGGRHRPDRCVAFGDSMSDAPLFRRSRTPSPSTPTTTCSTSPPPPTPATTSGRPTSSDGR